MTQIRGQFTTAKFEGNITKIDCRDMIFQLEPDESPFVTIMAKINKLVATNYQYSWFEDAMIANYTRINDAGNYTSSETVLIVDDATIFQVYDVIKDTASLEVMLVVGIDDNAQTITVKRGWGTTSLANIYDNDYLYKLGNAQSEGYTSPESLVTAKVPLNNYVQTFAKTIQITERAANINTWGGNRRDYERNKKGRELKRDIEAQFLFGEPKLDTTSGEPRTQTGGIYYHLIGNGCAKLDMNDARLTETAWEGFMRDLFTYGSSNKIFFAGPRILSQISSFALAKQRMTPGKTTKYGVKINTYHSTMGDVDLVLDKHFTGPHAGAGLGLQIDQLVYRYLQNMDFTLRTNVQNKKDHYLMDEYSATIGLELHQAKYHGYVEKVAA